MILNTTKPKILTNMAFWQSATWMQNVNSIYSMENRKSDPIFFSPLKEARLLYGARKKYDVILTMGDRTSFWYGLLCALTFGNSKQIMTEIFIDAPKSNFFWLLKNRLFRLIARRSLGVLTNSSAEVATVGKRFRLHNSKLRYVPLHTNIHEPHLSEKDDGFILSAGRTLRDYGTLIQASLMIRKPVHIIAGRDDILSITYPSNVTVHRELSREHYLDLLERCKMVVVPLLPTERVTGQVVLLEAMSVGKPVIATRVPGTVDLIQDEITGLLIPPRDPDELIDAVQKIDRDDVFAKKLTTAALERIKKYHGFETHAEKKIKAIVDLSTHTNTIN